MLNVQIVLYDGFDPSDRKPPYEVSAPAKWRHSGAEMQ